MPTVSVLTSVALELRTSLITKYVNPAVNCCCTLRNKDRRKKTPVEVSQGRPLCAACLSFVTDWSREPKVGSVASLEDAVIVERSKSLG